MRGSAWSFYKKIIIAPFLFACSLPVSAQDADFEMPKPLFLGAVYDDVLKDALFAEYAQDLNETVDLNAIAEYGVNQYRINGTFDYQIRHDTLVKVGGEYLSQRLPFTFDSGEVEQRLHQTALGVRGQYLMNKTALKQINFGGYWAKTADSDLHIQSFVSGGATYNNQRMLAGATSQGVDVRGVFLVNKLTSLDVGLYFDDIKYKTELSSNDFDNNQGLGASLKVNRLLNEQTKFSAEASNRKIYNTYNVEIAHYISSFGQESGLKLSLFVQRLSSRNDERSSNLCGFGFSFLGPQARRAHDLLNTIHTNTYTRRDRWIKDPAIYLERVIVNPEQLTPGFGAGGYEPP